MAVPKLRFKEFDGDWILEEIKKVFTNKSESFNPLKNENLPCVELEHLSQNTGQIIGTVNSIDQQSTKNLFESNSVLYGKLRPYLRKFANPQFKGVCSSEIWVLTGIKISNDYLFQFVQSEQFSELTNIQSGSKMPRADWNLIADAEIEYPSKEEQTQIASFLSVVDEKISQLTQKHELLSQYKQGMMQKLFSQQIRFKADDGREFGEWKKLKFKTFIKERSKICSDSEVELCSLTIEKGVTEKTERYTRDFLVKDESNAYKEVHFNDFVMNPMNLRFGAIAKSNIRKLVKISKYYNVFYINEDIVYLDYFTSFAISKPMIDFYNLMSTGSLIEKRRNHFKDFIEYEKLFPCLEEQTKIAHFVSAIDQKIEVVAQQIEQAKQWKKGLLQQMFV